jgi:hypothetical protein
VEDVDVLAADGAKPAGEGDEILIKPEERLPVSRPLTENVLARCDKIVVGVPVLRADLFAHEEHRGARRQQR